MKGLVDSTAPVNETGPKLDPAELAQLLGAFNSVSAQLQETHQTLTAEVKRLRGQLRDANERLHRSRRLAALGEMAAGIAHEIRNPLGSIGLYAEMLASDLESQPEQAAYAKRIGDAVRGLNAIVGDVLHLARDQKVRRVPTTGRELLESALRAVEGSAPAGVRVLCDAPEDGPEIACDPNLVKQALVNVIRNAFDAIRAAGLDAREHSVIAEARCAEDDDCGPGAVVLRVRDTGDGIPEDLLDRMFNPFFTTRDTGTGLGLAIVHRIADAHGGRVAARNNADERPGEPGATFEIVLGAGEQEREQGQEEDENTTEAPGEIPDLETDRERAA